MAIGGAREVVGRGGVVDDARRPRARAPLPRGARLKGRSCDAAAERLDGQAPVHRHLPLPDRQQAHHRRSCRARAGAAGRPRRCRRGRARSSRCSPRDRSARGRCGISRARRAECAPSAATTRSNGPCVAPLLVDDAALVDIDDLRAGDQHSLRAQQPSVQQVEQRAAPDAQSEGLGMQVGIARDRARCGRAASCPRGRRRARPAPAPRRRGRVRAAPRVRSAEAEAPHRSGGALRSVRRP